jgi:hypothetical protein
VLRLYFPLGYLARGAPLFVALTTGVWVARMIAREHRPRTILDTRLVKLRASPAVLGILLVALIGLYEHRETFTPMGDLRTRHFDRTKLYDAVRQLPGGIMLATHPRLASELPLMTGRSVVISSKIAHPWWTEHWTWCRDRLHGILRAYYADDAELLVEVTRRYGIDYWIVDQRRYRGSSLERGGMYFEPFKSWARENLRLDGRSILRRVPRRYRHWDDGRAFFIVAAEDLERFVEELGRRGPRIPAQRSP